MTGTTSRVVADGVEHDLVLEALPVPVAVTDLTGRLLEANAAFRALSPLSLQPQLQALVAGMRPPDTTPDTTAVTSPAVAEVLLVVRDEQVPCQLRLVHRSDGQPGWWSVRVAEPPPAATHDPLTGLAHRQLLLQRLDHALLRRARSGALVELVVLDLDDFKQVNDVRGHVVGDRVLVEVAARLQSIVRPADTVCRWGGDEFVVLLEEPDEVGGGLLCARVEEALAVPVLAEGGPVEVALSSGWVRAVDGESALDLLHRADLQMYVTKRGRKSPAQVGPVRQQALQRRLQRARARAALLSAASASARSSADRTVRLITQDGQDARDGRDGRGLAGTGTDGSAALGPVDRT